MKVEQKSLSEYLKQFAIEKVGSSRLYNYSANRITALDACFVLSLSRPLIRQYDGCFFIEDLFDIAAYESWRGVFGRDSLEIELKCNMIGMKSMISEVNISEHGVRMLADNMRQNWVTFIAQQIDFKFEVPILLDDIGNPSLSFYVVR